LPIAFLLVINPHPILLESFAIIDREMGDRQFQFTPAEYAIVRRVVHSTADFEFADLLRFSPHAIEGAITALRSGTPIITDVSMVERGVATVVSQTFQNPLITAVDRAQVALPGKTRTETGLLTCWQEYPTAIYAIGNAPTALMGLCSEMTNSDRQPSLIIGAPVGFVGVLEAKEKLAHTPVPQIRVEGRKGGSPATAAILNALLILAWEMSSS
jgi:precorrin-8X/cobalt-precorrin-8 methylmutase